AKLLRFGFEALAPGDEDELVVGRDAELVDGSDDGSFAALAQVDALDVAEAAEHRVGGAADEGGKETEADVDRFYILGRQLHPGENRLQEGVLVGDPGGGDGPAFEIGDAFDAGFLQPDQRGQRSVD